MYLQVYKGQVYDGIRIGLEALAQAQSLSWATIALGSTWLRTPELGGGMAADI